MNEPSEPMEGQYWYDTDAGALKVWQSNTWVIVDPVKSVALQRIIDEVRNEQDERLSSYNRVYHRHNR